MTLLIHAWSPLRPASNSGSAMFCAALIVGTRLKAWETKPMRSRRRIVSRWSSSVLRSTSPMKALPDVRSSRPATQCSKMDFPEPEGPMMAAARPGRLVRVPDAKNAGRLAALHPENSRGPHVFHRLARGRRAAASARSTAAATASPIAAPPTMSSGKWAPT
jgi:hypothetical protein